MDYDSRVIGAVALFISVGFGMAALLQIRSLSSTVHLLQNQVAELATTTTAATSNIIAQASSTAREAVMAEQAAQTAQATLSKSTAAPSEDKLVTSTVSRLAPAVVSIVISEDVPNLQVTYVNPFGNNPDYQNFGLEIPVYQQQNGSSLQETGAGSGFLISHDGYILTNRHVVDDTQAEYTVLLANGTQKPATVVYRDPNNDVAVIKIDGTYPVITTLGDSSDLQVGQTVVAVGNALGEYNNSVSVGIISGLNRTVQASDENGNTETLSNVIQTDAAINPGNSGGPLTDLYGNVIGVNVATVVGGNSISFALPINSLKSAISEYVQ